MNSSLMRINSEARVSISVMRPWPTLLFPDHKNCDPTSPGAPSKSFLQAGSILAHGDQGCQLWKSFTWANTVTGGAFIVVERVIRKSFGRMDTMTMNRTIIAATVINIGISIVVLFGARFGHSIIRRTDKTVKDTVFNIF